MGRDTPDSWKDAEAANGFQEQGLKVAEIKAFLKYILPHLNWLSEFEISKQVWAALFTS